MIQSYIISSLQSEGASNHQPHTPIITALTIALKFYSAHRYKLWITLTFFVSIFSRSERPQNGSFFMFCLWQVADYWRKQLSGFTLRCSCFFFFLFCHFLRQAKQQSIFPFRHTHATLSGISTHFWSHWERITRVLGADSLLRRFPPGNSTKIRTMRNIFRHFSKWLRFCTHFALCRGKSINSVSQSRSVIITKGSAVLTLSVSKVSIRSIIFLTEGWFVYLP